MPHNQLWQYRISVAREDSVNYASTNLPKLNYQFQSNILYYEKKLLF